MFPTQPTIVKLTTDEYERSLESIQGYAVPVTRFIGLLAAHWPMGLPPGTPFTLKRIPVLEIEAGDRAAEFFALLRQNKLDHDSGPTMYLWSAYTHNDGKGVGSGIVALRVVFRVTGSQERYDVTISFAIPEMLPVLRFIRDNQIVVFVEADPAVPSPTLDDIKTRPGFALETDPDSIDGLL